MELAGGHDIELLVSIPKSGLTDFIGRLSKEKVLELDAALEVALGIE
jgi:mRNA-degrading endonuclease toxin of MazEF toxin-antitoxin module